VRGSDRVRTNTRPDWSKCLWRKTGQNLPDALILAGNHLFAGGPDKVGRLRRRHGPTAVVGSRRGACPRIGVANAGCW